MTAAEEQQFPIDVVALVDEAKFRKIKNYPCHVNRASQIGHPCLRFLTYSRTHWQEKRLHDVGLQRVFDLGNLYERAVLDDLREAGLYLEEQQSAGFDKRYQLSIHIDGKLPLDGHKYPVEIKSMSPYVWAKIETWRDFLEAKSPYLRSYPYQMTAYLFLHSEDQGIFFLKNKVSGELKQIVMPLDYDLAEEILQKCEAINAHVAAETLPDQIEWEEAICGRCGFLHICYPGRDWGDGLTIVDDTELEEMLKKREALIGAVRAYDEVDKALKAAIKEKTGLLVGNWQINGKWVDKKGFEVPAKKYWLSSIKKAPVSLPEKSLSGQIQITPSPPGALLVKPPDK